jgi:hypothetical protein
MTAPFARGLSRRARCGPHVQIAVGRAAHAHGSQSGRVFKGHKGRVSLLALSTDDKTLFSASADATLRSWSVSSGDVSNVIAVRCAVAPGRRLGRIVPQALRSYGGFSGEVRAMAVSWDGRVLYAEIADNTMRAWGVESGTVRTSCGPPLCLTNRHVIVQVLETLRRGTPKYTDKERLLNKGIPSPDAPTAAGPAPRYIREGSSVLAFDAGGMLAWRTAPAILTCFRLNIAALRAPADTVALLMDRGALDERKAQAALPPSPPGGASPRSPGLPRGAR